jgi:signal transduction histidine kinase
VLDPAECQHWFLISASAVSRFRPLSDNAPAMDGLQLRPLPVSLFGLTVALEIAAVPLSWGLEPRWDTLLYAVSSVTLAGAGALIASRQPRNAIGWLFCGVALVNAFAADAAQGWALRSAEAGWRGGDAAQLLASAGRQPIGLAWILTFLLFPDGRLPSRRWRAVVWAAAAGTVLTVVGWSLSADQDTEFPSGRNPFAVDWLPTSALFMAGVTLSIAALLASATSLVLRFRRSRGVERQQLKWFAFAAFIAAVVLPLSFVLWFVTPVGGVLVALALAALPIAACIAILRYRIYDIDVVINRTLVYGALTLLLATTFAATVVLLGTLLGRGSGWTTAAATLVVAVAFRPLRGRVQDAVDRRFNRARYSALRRMAGFLEDLRAGRAAPEEVEGVLREVLSDRRLDLLFFLPKSEVYADVRGVTVSEFPNDGREPIPVERGRQPLGMVLHDPASQENPTLFREVVEAGGLAIEIARLRVELRRQLAEVEASRARIVTAGHKERRRLERDLHDGAQQRLVSIGLALRHAQHELGTSSPEHAGRTLDGALAEVAVAIDELRELARGLPPAQLDAGLGPALRELARRAPVPVEVKAPGERFERDLEAAAYFIACEGLTNAVKHASATRIVLSAGRENGRLIVSVADDGVGGATPIPGSGLGGLSDRVAAHRGTLRIESDEGAGTTLTAELPCGS